MYMLFTHSDCAKSRSNWVLVIYTGRREIMIELCLWCTFRGYAAFDTFCVIAFSSYFATQFRLLCIDTNLVMLPNAEKLGVWKLTQGEGYSIELVY